MNHKFFVKSDEYEPLFKEGVVILIDKPFNWTSFAVVNKVRYRLSKIEGVKRIKVGHAGTLDPLATGLLILCTGKYTKMIDQFQGMKKRYTGTITLGSTTPSYDLETEIDHNFPTDHLSEEMIRGQAQKFVGAIQQKPPIYSAIKSGGERLYKKARRGESIEIKAREVVVDDFEIVNIEMPEVDFKLDCSKGTYVRSLAHDLGQALDTGAHLSRLRRERIGEYDVSDAWNLKELIEVLDDLLLKKGTHVS